MSRCAAGLEIGWLREKPVEVAKSDRWHEDLEAAAIKK